MLFSDCEEMYLRLRAEKLNKANIKKVTPDFNSGLVKK